MADEKRAFKKVRQGLHYEEWHVGDVYETDGRTVTETEIIIFAGLIGAGNPQFLDEEYAKTTPLGGRVAPGPLGLSLALASMEPLLAGTLIALIGIDNVRYHRPIRPGDTVHNEIEIIGARPTGGGSRGIIDLSSTLKNQRGEPLITYQHTLMMKRLPQES